MMSKMGFRPISHAARAFDAADLKGGGGADSSRNISSATTPASKASGWRNRRGKKRAAHTRAFGDAPYVQDRRIDVGGEYAYAHAAEDHAWTQSSRDAASMPCAALRWAYQGLQKFQRESERMLTLRGPCSRSGCLTKSAKPVAARPGRAGPGNRQEFCHGAMIVRLDLARGAYTLAIARCTGSAATSTHVEGGR